MNILAQAIPGNTYSGFQRAVQKDGHRWVWWEDGNTPAFDVFDEVQPDIVFCTSWTSLLNKCINEFNVTSVFCATNIPFTFVIRKDNDTIATFNFEYLVDNLTYYVDNKPPVSELVCDIGVACRPNKTTLNLCGDPRNLNVKVVSDTPWNVSQYLGFMSIHQKREFYKASSVVMVDDVTEAVKVMACGSLPVSVVHIENLPIWNTTNHNDIVDYIYDVVQGKPELHTNTILGLRKQLEGHSYVDAWTTIKRALQSA